MRLEVQVVEMLMQVENATFPRNGDQFCEAVAVILETMAKHIRIEGKLMFTIRIMDAGGNKIGRIRTSQRVMKEI